MNKKGFTLIELLATIVIMGLILAFVMPAIDSLQNNNKTRPYELYAKSMLSAARKDMLGATLYLVGCRTDTQDYEDGAAPCLMCRKMIINSGIKDVIVRVNKTEYKIIDVAEWINNDEILNGEISY